MRWTRAHRAPKAPLRSAASATTAGEPVPLLAVLSRSPYPHSNCSEHRYQTDKLRRRHKPRNHIAARRVSPQQLDTAAHHTVEHNIKKEHLAAKRFFSTQREK